MTRKDRIINLCAWDSMSKASIERSTICTTNAVECTGFTVGFLFSDHISPQAQAQQRKHNEATRTRRRLQKIRHKHSQHMTNGAHACIGAQCASIGNFSSVRQVSWLLRKVVLRGLMQTSQKAREQSWRIIDWQLNCKICSEKSFQWGKCLHRVDICAK